MTMKKIGLIILILFVGIPAFSQTSPDHRKKYNETSAQKSMHDSIRDARAEKYNAIVLAGNQYSSDPEEFMQKVNSIIAGDAPPGKKSTGVPLWLALVGFILAGALGAFGATGWFNIDVFKKRG